jgi:hypothetical protein
VIQFTETQWREIVADRRRLVGEARTMRHLINTLMRMAAFHHAATAPQEPFHEFVGISQTQYDWWRADIIKSDEEHGPAEGE